MGWSLEVGRMFLYVLFPVAMFHVFNQPKIFEKWVIDSKKKLIIPSSVNSFEGFKEFKTQMQQRLRQKRHRIESGLPQES